MLILPNRTKKVLETNTAYQAFVYSCISNMTPWLNENKTVFFPEYTDHGFTHLNEVLMTADSIISDDSWPHLTAQDTAAMVISVMLHDCAMHITEDAFYALINDKFPKVESRYTNKESDWSEVWRDYFAEAKRFDAKKLRSIFGDETPVRTIPENKIDLSGRDKLLIGEFIRRYHARLAHEIAFYGVPGVDGASILLAAEPDRNFLDLCGFIARRHNLGLREAVDMLEINKKQVHLNTHVPFIMLLLRISDYIQIHAERAPKQLLHLKMLVSPISIGEWKKHHSIVEINQAHEDPEAIYVDAEPMDAIVYQELKKLLSDIQSELDLSWSVLGEVYGRYDNLKNLGITIRRVKSSLDSLSAFIVNKKPKYIPKVLRFKTADSEMMELLIAPLYGDNPEIGIRELVQNSIDACSELKDMQLKTGRVFSKEPNFDVCITLYDYEDKCKLVIEDNGIGMTLDVVENYFLNIGASFRNSERWKKNHETDGHSNVYRTGRFGIGLLAAYLLGEELEVETRHASQPENKALLFKCRKGCESIVVSHTDFHVGTRITINISNEIRSRLLNKEDLWDWFSLTSHKVVRRIVGGSRDYDLEQSRSVPSSGSNINNTHWNRTTADGYDDILWTYSQTKNNRSVSNDNNLICNGIIVTDRLQLERFNISEKLGFIDVDIPTLNIFDQDGRLPINLERSSLVGRTLPFKSEIAKDLSSYLAKKMIAFTRSFEPVILGKNLLTELSEFFVPGLSRNNPYFINLLACKFIIKDQKLIPLDYDLISKEKVDRIFIDATNIGMNKGAWTSPEFVNSCKSYMFVDKITESKISRSMFIRTFFEFHEFYNGRPYGIAALPVCGKRVLIKKSDVDEIVTPSYVPKTFWRRLNCEWENDIWLLASIGDVPKLDFNVEKISKELDESQSFGFICCYLQWDEIEEKGEPSIFSKAWLKENELHAVMDYATNKLLKQLEIGS